MADYTEQEILAELERRQNTAELEPKSNIESAKQLVGGFGERIKAIFQEGKQNIGDVVKAASEGEHTVPFETTFQMLGKGVAGPALNLIGETVGTGVGAVSDLINPKIRQGMHDVMRGIVESEPAQQFIQMYQGLDPNTQRNVESTLNIANIISPFKIKAKTGEGIGDAITGGLTVVSKRTALQKDMLKSMFQPIKSKQNLENQLLNKQAIQGVDDMVDDLLDVKGLSPVRSPEANMKFLTTHMDKLEGQILNKITAFDKTGVMRDVTKSFDQLVGDVINNSPSMRELGLEPAKAAALQQSIMRKFKGVVANLKDEGINPNSLKGLLVARRRLDKALREADFKKMKESQIGDVALEKHVVLEMRGKINEAISGFVKQFDNADPTIEKLLKKESSIFKARSNYAERTAHAMQDIGERGALTKALASHPLLVYGALRNSGAAPVLAGVLAVPSALNTASQGIGVARRLPGAPMGRAGLFYGAEETPEEYSVTEEQLNEEMQRRGLLPQ